MAFPITIPVVLKALQAIGPVAARLPEFKAFYDQVVASFSSKTDQATLKKAHEELLAENTGGHERLQEMLRKASATPEEAVKSSARDLSGKPTPGIGG